MFTYAYTLRGFSLGCQPKGFISHNDNIGKYGTITYDRELTDKELFEYDLIPYKDNTIENNKVYYFNEKNHTTDINTYNELYFTLLDIEKESPILDNEILFELINGNECMWIKIINDNPYYNNDTILCDINFMYINKPISFYIDKSTLYNVINQ